MNILHRLDAWLGKTLFHPPIILLCQMTHQSQYAIHRAFWFIAACHATYYAQGDGWGWTIFLWIWTILLFISATVWPDRETLSLAWFRFLIWALLLLEVPVMLAESHLRDEAVRSIIILFAEYAATIKTIPPRKTRERSASGKAARS